MAVTASDIALKYSVSAAAGNTTSGTAATSLGDQVSTTAIPQSGANVWFDDVPASEASAGDTEYRCAFVHNTHSTDSALNVEVVLQTDPAGGATMAIGLDTTAASAVGSASAQALTVANENTAPAGVTFGTSNLNIGTLAAGQVKAFWVRRTISAAQGPVVGDGFTVRIQGEG
jgi:hypothetical protein